MNEALDLNVRATFARVCGLIDQADRDTTQLHELGAREPLTRLLIADTLVAKLGDVLEAAKHSRSVAARDLKRTGQSWPDIARLIPRTISPEAVRQWADVLPPERPTE